MSHPAHLWQPVSPCGEGCLPAAGTVPAVGRVCQLLRVLGVLTLTLVGALLALVFPLLSAATQKRAQRSWFRALLGALRIRLEVTGGRRFAPPGAAVLVVSNHISWLDLVVLGAVQPLRMVAKREVRSWPLIGLLAARAGTMFVDRKRLSTLPSTVAVVGTALRAGAAVGVFPEATTCCGRSRGRFRPAIFQAAVDTTTPVRPVALRYRLAATPGRATTVAAFVGATALWRAVVLVAGARGLVVEVELLPMLPTGLDRRSLAVLADRLCAHATRSRTAPALGWCLNDVSRSCRHDPDAARSGGSDERGTVRAGQCLVTARLGSARPAHR